MTRVPPGGPARPGAVMSVRMRIAVALLVVAAAVVIVAVVRLPSASPGATLPPAGGRQGGLPAPARGPREVVLAYLQALDRKDYRAAYQHLSRRSQQAHPYAEFEDACERAGLPSYDLGAVREKPGERGDQVTVVVPLSEDVAEASFVTAREEGGWKVVFIGGAPGFPYP